MRCPAPPPSGGVAAGDTGNYTGEALDAVTFDFEKQAQQAVLGGLKKRFPSAKLPVIAYLDNKE